MKCGNIRGEWFSVYHVVCGDGYRVVLSDEKKEKAMRGKRVDDLLEMISVLEMNVYC